MMNDQKIIDNVPPKQGKWPDCNQIDSDGKWSHRQPLIRSLADVKRIVELENLLKKFRPMDENGDGWDFVYNEGSEYLGAAVLEALKAGN
jgi:hypothetical protein